MKQSILALSFSLLSAVLFAQNDVQFTHFVFNKLSYNPAYAGAAEAPVLSALYRNQWVNLDGAPVTATLNYHTTLSKDRVGLGFSITADKVGMVNTNSIEANYSYRFSAGEGKLSLGVNGRLEQGTVKWSEAAPLELGDGSIPAAEEQRLSPNFGFGLFYQRSNFYLGLSIPRLMRTTIYRDLSIDGSRSGYRTFYLMSGLVTEIAEKVKFQPGAMISYNSSAPFEVDLNANLIFMDTFWLGGNYRLGDSFSALIQYQFTPRLRTGVAFDFTMTELNSYTNGSIEVMITYGFNRQTSVEAGQIHNLRYF